MWEVTPPFAPSRAVLLALAVPVLVTVAWSVRTPPAPWGCGDPPPGHAESLAAWREGAGAALALGTALLVAGLTRLSADRRTVTGRTRRPGLHTCVGCAVLAGFGVAPLVHPPAIEAVSGLGLALAVLSPAIALFVVGRVIWLVTGDRPCRGQAFAALATWCSLLVTVGGVGGVMGSLGTPGLCMS